MADIATDQSILASLADAWNNLARRCRADDAASAAVFAELVAAYREPGRFYHDLRHVADMLAILRHHGAPVELELAAWFHDAVYESRALDNEDRSAVLATDALHRMGLAAEHIERVATLIRMTRDHRTDPDDADAQLLLDADLAILGATPEKYNEYAHAIRQEYAWVPEARYRGGRRAVLQRFLDRPRIFTTGALYQEREASARRNLSAEIAALSTTE
jgi:predicted metal-dependent HD superfamily phosphohydrolase